MNYGELRTAIAGWLQRSDLTAMIPTFVDFAEARIAREFRLRQQLVFTTLTLSAAETTLPADFLEFKAVVYQDDATPLRVGSAEQVMTDQARISGYRPKFCVVTDDSLYVGPIPDSNYVVNAAYYGKFPALTLDADTNWLLTNYPTVYMWAALSEAAPFLQDDRRTIIWEGKYDQDKTQIQEADRAAEYSPTGLELSFINTQEVV